MPYLWLHHFGTRRAIAEFKVALDSSSWDYVNRTAPAARQILSYFVRNPSAADSLEGIAKWRLLEEAIYRNVLETKEALEWLVQEGYLVETSRPHSGRTFQLNAEKHAEAMSFLDLEEQ